MFCSFGLYSLYCYSPICSVRVVTKTSQKVLLLQAIQHIFDQLHRILKAQNPLWKCPKMAEILHDTPIKWSRSWSFLGVSSYLERVFGVLLAIATKLLCKLTNLFQVTAQSKTGLQVRNFTLPATWSFWGLPGFFLPRYPAVYKFSVDVYGVAAKLLWWWSASTSSPTWIQPMQSRCKQIFPSCTQCTRGPDNSANDSANLPSVLCAERLRSACWNFTKGAAKAHQIPEKLSTERNSDSKIRFCPPCRSHPRKIRASEECWTSTGLNYSLVHSSIAKDAHRTTHPSVHKMVLRRAHKACVAKVL